jgi:hypothetical protein
MKHTDYQSIIEAAQKLTKSKAETEAGAHRALRQWLQSRQSVFTTKNHPINYPDCFTWHRNEDGKWVQHPPKTGSTRDAWYSHQWRFRAERGGEKIMKSMKLKSRWDDLNSKRPRDPFNRELAKTRRKLKRDQYGALYMPVIDTAQPYRDEYDRVETSAHRFRLDWLQSRAAEPTGLSAAWECVRAIEKAADEHGGWDQRSQWDSKGRGEQITVDLYGIDAAARLYVIQVRQSYRAHKNYFLSVRKSYFMIGHNENGNPFAHPISAGIVHAAIRRDPSPESPVRAAQAWIWGIEEKRLPDVLRNGDVALIPAKAPKTNIDIFSAGEYRVDDDVASDHHVIADQIIANGAIYALNPILYHRKNQHPEARGEGWFKVVVGRRADFWDFARPTVD